MPKDNIITALDIGASKICSLMGRPVKNNVIDVLGYGVSHHRCLRHGVVVDIKGLSEAISRAVYEVEETSGKKVHSVFFNICGSHIKGEVSRGEIAISDRDNEITRHDVERVIDNAKSINLPYERDIIHIVRRGFVVDGEKGIVNPAGMFGLKLETELFLVTAKISVIDNIKKAVRQAGIGIENYIISGIATASSVLSQHEKDLGVILIDIGADITEILIFLEGRIAFTEILPTGGDKITKAISDKFRIPEGAAERIKIENGTLEVSRPDDKISLVVDSRRRTVSRKELRKVLISEYEKLFNAIRRELNNSGCFKDVSCGAVICGGAAMMEGSLESAELILNCPVKIGHIMGLGSSPKPLASYIYAEAVGLLKYGAEVKQSKKSILHMGPKNVVLAAAGRLRNLYRDYF